jgi:hypothetical protein
MTSLSHLPPSPPPPHLLPSCLPCIAFYLTHASTLLVYSALFRAPINTSQTKYSTLLCPLPHSCGSPKRSHLPHTFPFSPLCPLPETSICLTLPSAPLVPVPFGLPSTLLCSLLHFDVCPTLPSYLLLPSAPLCPPILSALCFTLPSAMLHSAI